ncbi:ZNRF1 isoform 4, partial [Pan troglodytes]
DVLTKDAGECVICLEELLQGDTIARLPCLCIYHKRDREPLLQGGGSPDPGAELSLGHQREQGTPSALTSRSWFSLPP